MKILFIGTGVMGAPMALHLARHGKDVTVYNRTLSKAKRLEPHVKVSSDLYASSKEADVIFSIVGYPKDVEDIYNIIIPNAKKGAILIDMTTSSPALAKKLYKKAKDHGLYMLDAPVTGGDLGAIQASLSIMVGGDKEIYLKIHPLLEMMGKTITYMGEAGNGQYMKLANQIVIAGNILGIAEGLYFAQMKGLDLEDTYSVIVGGSASSWQAKVNGLKMIHKDYVPGFFLKHFLKDLRLALDESNNLDLPLLRQAEKTYAMLSELHEDDGTQIIIEAYLNKQL